MEKITGNEPAMPTTNSVNGTELNDGGLTIRQHFAAMAMQGLCANDSWATGITPDNWDDYTDRLTSGAVEIADKLILQLNNPNQ